MSDELNVVELCAGAGGQALGLEQAGFEHSLAVELDANAAATLRANRPHWNIAEGDVANPDVWTPATYTGIDLLAGGVPCPPFSIAGKQLGAADERDLFAWAIELTGRIKPRALMLENVRGLASSRFGAYREHVLDRLHDLGYVVGWRLLHAANFGVPQLRPRFVLVALRPDDEPYFNWPAPQEERITVANAIGDLMAADRWPHVDDWLPLANGVGPTLVGGSKKHGGADLGPTRAKQAWRELGVDGRGLADAPPAPDAPHPSERLPRLTVEMAARIQGWSDDWTFTGGKTTRYRQVGNAFPPPVARALGIAIRNAISDHGRDLGQRDRQFADALTAAADKSKQTNEATGVQLEFEDETILRMASRSAAHRRDSVYCVLAQASRPLTGPEIAARAGQGHTLAQIKQKIESLAKDFNLIIEKTGNEETYRLGSFLGFTGQADHYRHSYFSQERDKVS